MFLKILFLNLKKIVFNLREWDREHKKEREHELGRRAEGEGETDPH